MMPHFSPFIYMTQALRTHAGMQAYTTGQRLGWFFWYQIDGVGHLTPTLGKPWRLRAGQIGLAQPGTAAAWKSKGHVLRMYFDIAHEGHVQAKNGKSLKPLSADAQPDAASFFDTDLPPIIDSPLDSEAIGLVREADNRIYSKTFAREELSLRLGLWLLRYVRQQKESFHQSKPQGEHERLVHRAESLMRTSSDTRPTIADIAASLGISVRHFINVYTKLRGEGPGAFLGRQRLLFAQQLLRTTDLTVERAARRAGFASARGLHQAFIREHGISPSVWRRSQHL